MPTDTYKTITVDHADGGEEVGFKPLTSDEARKWRHGHKQVSIWRVVLAQATSAVLVGMFGAVLFDSAEVGWSVFYGGMAVVLPSVVMAHGMTSGRLAKLLSVIPVGSLGSVLFWEGIKVLLAVVMLMVAPVVIDELNWLALLAGLVTVLKVYWLAFLLLTRVSK